MNTIEQHNFFGRIQAMSRKAVIRRSGIHVTLVTGESTLSQCIGAASALVANGISAEIVEVRSLCPLDEAAILRSVRKTGRLIVAQDGSEACSFGAEVAALVAEKAFVSLREPVIRLSGSGSSPASNDPNGKLSAPRAETIAATARMLVGEIYMRERFQIGA